MLYSNHNILALDPIGSGHLEIQNWIQSNFGNLNGLNPQSKLNCETLYNQSASHMLPIYSNRANVPIPKGRNKRPQIHRDTKARPNPIETMLNPETPCSASKASGGILWTWTVWGGSVPIILPFTMQMASFLDQVHLVPVVIFNTSSMFLVYPASYSVR